jgi:subtilisin family serine protease
MQKTAGTRAGAIPALNYVPDEVLIRFDEQTPHRLMAAAHAEVGAVVVHEYDSVPNLKLVKLPKGMRVQAALEYYKQIPGVHYVHPNSIHEVLTIPNDPLFGELWGLQNTGQRGGRPGADIHAPEAWAITTGDHEVVVAVLDTGIDYQHSDLAANMFRNEAECIPNGIDDDDNGVVDDCYGFNALDANSPPMDDEGHGTHVAGTIGAVGNNTLGVIGVNWNVRLLACKWLNYEGKGYDSDAIKCLDYVAMLKQRGVNIVATSNSWGGGAYNQGLRDAIDRQRQLGVLSVAAAGNSASNSDNDATPHYPSSYDVPNIIAVAATTRTDGLAWFSNVGRRTVHLGAPGTDILSTYLPDSSPVITGYQWLSGTSMATPHVSGVAALLKARYPAWDWKAIKNTIVASGDPLPALANTISGRRLNAERALTCANAPVLSRLTPISTSLVGSTGDPIQLSVLHINCDQPNGEVTVRVDPPGEQVVLHDDGQKPDQEPRDGIYTGQWTPTAAGTFTLTFPDGSVVTVTVPLQYHYEATAFRWRTIDGTTLNLGDNETSTISTPFSIRFAGARFPTLRVNSNGILWGQAKGL